jgi:hypothetical protein
MRNGNHTARIKSLDFFDSWRKSYGYSDVLEDIAAKVIKICESNIGLYQLSMGMYLQDSFDRNDFKNLNEESGFQKLLLWSVPISDYRFGRYLNRRFQFFSSADERAEWYSKCMEIMRNRNNFANKTIRTDYCIYLLEQIQSKFVRMEWFQKGLRHPYFSQAFSWLLPQNVPKFSVELGNLYLIQGRKQQMQIL